MEASFKCESYRLMKTGRLGRLKSLIKMCPSETGQEGRLGMAILRP